MISTYIFTFDGWCAGSDKIAVESLAPYADWLAYPPDGGETPFIGPNPTLVWVGVGATDTSLYIDGTTAPYISRPLSRVGGWVRLYDASGDPLGRWMILTDGPASDVGYGEGFILVHVDGVETLPVDSGFIRLEDPRKLCTTIPTWIPEDSEAYSRWIPVVVDFSGTNGQNVPIKGGVSETDGFSVTCILDRFEPDLSRVYRLRPDAWEWIDTVTGTVANTILLGRYTVDGIRSTVTDSQTDLVVATSIDGEMIGDFDTFNHPPSFEDLINADLFPFLGEDSTTPTVVEPTFFGVEGVWLDTSSPETSDESFWVYDNVERHVAKTARLAQRANSLAFNGLPSPIGATCSCFVYTYSDFPWTDASPVPVYNGLTSGINYEEGMTQFEIASDSVLLTSSVASASSSKAMSQIRRSSVPKKLEPGTKLKFRNRFIARQRNPSDRFRWIKLGGVLFPAERQRLAEYEIIDHPVDIDRFERLYGIIPDAGDTAEERYAKFIEIEQATGLVDAFYYIGTFSDAIDRVFVKDLTDDTYPQFNAFSNPPASLYRFGAYRVEDLGGFMEWFVGDSIFVNPAFRSLNNWIYNGSGDTRENFNTAVKDFVLSWSNEEPALAHLFEPWCVGTDVVDDAPDGFEWAWYPSRLTVGGGPSVRGAYISVHPVDAVLQVLTSTGTGIYQDGVNTPGWNGPFDMLPSEFSLGIPLELINLESFKRVFRRISSPNFCRNLWTEIETDPLEWLSSSILEPLLLAIGTDGEGKVTLFDLSDFTEAFDILEVENTAFVRPAPDAKISVTTRAQFEDVADSFEFKWIQPWTDYADPESQQTFMVQGQAARGANGEIVTANIFTRIQRAPDSFDLPWAIPNAGAFAFRVQDYLTGYRRTLQRLTTTIRVDSEIYAGRNVIFSLPYVPDAIGEFPAELPIFLGKVMNSSIDRKKGIQEIEVIIYGESGDDLNLVWNLTALVEGVVGDDLEVSNNHFIAYPQSEAFAFDWSVFTVGSGVTVWTETWDKVVDTTITAISTVGGVTTISVVDAGAATPGCRLTLRTRDTSTSLLTRYLTWFRRAQRLG